MCLKLEQRQREIVVEIGAETGKALNDRMRQSIPETSENEDSDGEGKNRNEFILVTKRQRRIKESGAKNVILGRRVKDRTKGYSTEEANSQPPGSRRRPRKRESRSTGSARRKELFQKEKPTGRGLATSSYASRLK